MEETAERCAWFWEAAAFAAIVGTSRALVINTAAVQAARALQRFFFIMFLSSVKLFFSNFQGCLLFIDITRGGGVLLHRAKNFFLFSKRRAFPIDQNDRFLQKMVCPCRLRGGEAKGCLLIPNRRGVMTETDGNETQCFG